MERGQEREPKPLAFFDEIFPCPQNLLLFICSKEITIPISIIESRKSRRFFIRKLLFIRIFTLSSRQLPHKAIRVELTCKLARAATERTQKKIKTITRRSSCSSYVRKASQMLRSYREFITTTFDSSQIWTFVGRKIVFSHKHKFDLLNNYLNTRRKIGSYTDIKTRVILHDWFA